MDGLNVPGVISLTDKNEGYKEFLNSKTPE